MTPTEQVISLKYAKELKELGFEKESLFYWINPFKRQGWKIVCENEYDFNKHHEYYPAYTVAELGEFLPNFHYSYKSENWKTYYKGVSDILDNFPLIEAKTEADVRVKMLIYLIKKN